MTDAPQRTVPSVEALWDTQVAMKFAESAARYGQELRWRMSPSDWVYLQQQRTPVGEPIAVDAVDGVRRLFGTPVDLVDRKRVTGVDDPRDSLPELVLVCDRRNYA